MKKRALFILFFPVALFGFFPVLAQQDVVAPPDPNILGSGGQGGLLNNVADALFAILLLVAVIFFVAAGYQFVTASGDPERLKKARYSILYGLVGLIVAFSARALVKLVQDIAGRSG